jgi:cation-transporting P-type ATPase 13A2
MKLKGVWEPNSLHINENLKDCSEILQESLASCHRLSKLNGTLIGDPQEIAIFKSLDWEFIENEEFRCKLIKGNTQIKVLKLFHFSSVTKRMGVIVSKAGKINLYVKGAPEVVLPLCNSVHSTVYSNLLAFSQAGNRVLAFGYKHLESFCDSAGLECIEGDLNFLGLILLHNQLKSEAAKTINTLLEANIKCIISTGNALLTASAVGKACGIIDINEDIVLAYSLSSRKSLWDYRY